MDLYWGGRDAGRSRDAAQQSIVDCLNLKYFKCLLIKKTFNTIQESQWATIKLICEQWNIAHLFSFRVAPLGIECRENGNKFIARGCEDHQSIKSIQNPSHAWIEEMNQLSLEDFITVVTTLRANNQKVKLRGTLNPEFEGDYEDHWFYKTFIANRSWTGKYTWNLTIPGGKAVEYTYTLTHTTYKNNRHVTNERIAFLEMLATIDPYYYKVYTLGQPGRRSNNAPFCFAWSRDKHLSTVTNIVRWNPKQYTYATFDFNKRPMSCSIWQYYDNRLYGIEAIKLQNSDIYAMCDEILLHYPNALWLVTGDATGSHTTALVQDNINFYTIIKQKLRLGINQLKIPTVNPPVKENQVLVNAVLAMVPMTVDKDRCKPLIFDFENVRVMPDGSIEKKDRNDPTQQADFLDGFRYLCNTFFQWVLRENVRKAA